MIERVELRQPGAAIYDNADGTRTYRAHANMHYDNMLGLGDGWQGALRKVDKTFLPVTGGWEYQYGDDVCFVPSSWGRDTAYLQWYYIYDNGNPLRIRPDCTAVQGVLVSTGTLSGWPQIEYPDAFGAGVDLVIVPWRTRLQKLIRFRDLSKGGQTYRFEIDAATKPAFDTYVQGYSIWDADRESEPLTVNLVNSGGKWYLDKVVPDLTAMAGPVYTDATFGPQAANIADQSIADSAKNEPGASLTATVANWNVVRNANGSFAVFNIGGLIAAGYKNTAKGFLFARYQAFIDVNVAFSSIVSGTLTFTGVARWEPPLTGTDGDGVILQGIPQDPTAIINTDYELATRFGAVELTSNAMVGAPPPSTSTEILNLNAAGLALIPQNNKFMFGVALRLDVVDIYSGSGYPRMFFDDVESTSPPTLEFIYNPAVPTSGLLQQQIPQFRAPHGLPIGRRTFPTRTLGPKDGD